ncbi:MAG TPA: hypothetical protein VGV69_07940 [Solirubrobacterales bacterium]|nr:hypothetical protein [Solirubrobacterales bacterium]
MNKLKRHLSVANVLSCIALFVALGGTAFAAMHLGPGEVKAINIAKQAVTNAKIKQQAVTSGKIKNGGVNALDIGAGQVIGEKIATGAVTGKKIGKKAVSPRTIAEEAVTAGKLGNESVTASKLSASLYAQLVRNVAYESKTSVSDSEPNKSATATCPNGKQAISGGVRLEGELANVSVIGSYPLSSGAVRTGWEALAHETGGDIAGNWSVTAFVVCAEL